MLLLRRRPLSEREFAARRAGPTSRRGKWRTAGFAPSSSSGECRWRSKETVLERPCWYDQSGEHP